MSKEEKKFVTEYQINGKKYAGEIWATSWEKAECFIKQRASTEKVVGFIPSLEPVIEELPRVDTKKMKDQSDIDRENKEIYSLIMELGVTLADLNYQWPNKLRRKFEKVTSNLKETITMATKKNKSDYI